MKRIGRTKGYYDVSHLNGAPSTPRLLAWMVLSDPEPVSRPPRIQSLPRLPQWRRPRVPAPGPSGDSWSSLRSFFLSKAKDENERGGGREFVTHTHTHPTLNRAAFPRSSHSVEYHFCVSDGAGKKCHPQSQTERFPIQTMRKIKEAIPPNLLQAYRFATMISDRVDVPRTRETSFKHLSTFFLPEHDL